MSESFSPIVIGIAGGSGSGKTTVAQEVLARVGADKISFLPHDAYYQDFGDLSFSQRSAINFDHPDSLETNLLIEHIKQLKTLKPIELPIYDFKTHSRTAKTILIEPHPVILVDGILIFAEPELREMFDVKYMSIPTRIFASFGVCNATFRNEAVQLNQ